MERWERQKEIFELLERDDLTVRELTDILERKEETITLNLVDSLLRHYNRNGYLTRSKNLFDKYTYQLSDKGIEHLKGFLQSGEYLEYIDVTTY